MAKRRRKHRTHVPLNEETSASKVPKSFVMRSGVVGKFVTALVNDVRKCMEPNTATKLQERKSNKLRDFISVSGMLGVTHFIIFSRTETGTNLRIARVPRGPTITFRVTQYSLIKDVLALQKNPKAPGSEYRTSPLLVMNNFTSSEKQFKLITTMFQNLFPSINPQTMQLADARRVILLNYNNDTNRIDFRHYSITVRPTGVSKSVKRIITTELPDLGQFEDVADYVLREAFASESDVEDAGENTVTLAQNYVGRGNKKLEQRAVRLVELGPRMELMLVKIQEGLCGGEVLFHEFVQKTPEEIKSQKRQLELKKERTALRRKEQQENVERKKREKEEHRIRTGGKPKSEKDENESNEGENTEDESGQSEAEDDNMVLDESEEEGEDVEFSE